jgi:hypothetical protein
MAERLESAIKEASNSLSVTGRIPVRGFWSVPHILRSEGSNLVRALDLKSNWWLVPQS